MFKIQEEWMVNILNFFEVKNMLDKRDLEVLHNIYLLRCLTVSQIYYNYYKDDYTGVQDFRNKKLYELLETGTIEEVLFASDNSAIFLTRLGIDVVINEFKIPINLVESNGNITRGYHRAHELKLQPKNIPHQVHLNQFMIDFKTIYEYKNLTIPWEYYDEKYLSQYRKIRPDGMIQILDVDLFLEMDMSTESKSQLTDKWKNYKWFLNSAEHRNDRKVIVLFIIENTDLIENRKNLVKITANDIVLNDINETFEIIVGTKEELLTITFNQIIPDIKKTNYRKANIVNLLTSRYGFNVSDATSLKKKLGNQDYGFFARKLDESNNLLIENNKIQGYLVDYCYKDAMSTIAKISYLESNLEEFNYYYKWKPSYIIITDDLEHLHNELKLLKLDRIKNIYFTTIKDLESNIFPHALYQFDYNDEMYTFENNGLIKRHYLYDNIETHQICKKY